MKEKQYKRVLYLAMGRSFYDFCQSRSYPWGMLLTTVSTDHVLRTREGKVFSRVCLSVCSQASHDALGQEERRLHPPSGGKDHIGKETLKSLFLAMTDEYHKF